jgi:D-glycero-alpha-D-manno-heptose 1-phosphate guanylyltransferase
MQAIILVGGLGSRLRSISGNEPKPLIAVSGRPFLAFVLEHLVQQGIVDIILSVGYRKESIMETFGNKFQLARLRYAEEVVPLGTGGAIVNALRFVEEEDVLIINGDTLFLIDYAAMWRAYRESGAQLAIALKHTDDVGRYGVVKVGDGRVLAFLEKTESGAGLINGGIYIASRFLFGDSPVGTTFSFEKDFLMPRVGRLRPLAYTSDAYFIDIGIPDEYERAQRELKARY